MICDVCGGKGWTESYVGTAGRYTPSLEQCRKRCNISGYSSEVQRRTRPGFVTPRGILKPEPVAAPVYILRKRAHEPGIL